MKLLNQTSDKFNKFDITFGVLKAGQRIYQKEKSSNMYARNFEKDG